LDGVDNGGVISNGNQRTDAPLLSGFQGELFRADIVWPLAAQAAEITTLRDSQTAARRAQIDRREEREAQAQWEHTARHQAGAENMLASSAALDLPEINYHGRPLSEILRNPHAAGTNQLTLSQMLTPKQIITGNEPESVTFEVPMDYDAVTNSGELDLLVDTNNDDSEEGTLAQQMDLSPADNGNCRLTWSTIFECPGKHVLQIGLSLSDSPQAKQEIAGPCQPYVITNLCQVSLTSAHFDEDAGATLRAKLPELNATYTIEFNATNGTPLKAISGSTTDGSIKVYWDLIDKDGQRFTNNFFNSVIHLKLTDSGREQTMKGP
jgi:hypothetical protein